MSYFSAVGIRDGANLDAFSRLRVSNPHTLFDSTFQYDLQPLLYHAITATGGTIAHDAALVSAALAVTGTSGSSAILQTKSYHRYIPAKSQLLAITQVVGAAVENVTKRIGYFDAANGIFLEQAGTVDVALVRRTSTSGSPVDNRVAQDDWNLDTFDGNGPSGITLDLSKSSILIVDLQWLGMGRVRAGFDIDGIVYYAHEFKHANNLAVPYMQTANLPIRWEVASTAASAGATMLATCASVISEGGDETQTAYRFAAANGANVSVTTSRTCLLALRPAATFNGVVNRAGIAIEEFAALAGNNSILLELIYNPTLTGGTWAAANAYSAAEINTGATYSSGGIVIDNLWIASSNTNRGSQTADVLNRLPIALDAAGANPIPIAVVATSLTGTSDSRGRVAWKEMR